MIRRPPRPTLFPSTTLFRSLRELHEIRQGFGIALRIAPAMEQFLPLAHHAHVFVVEDEHLDWQVVLRSEEHTSELQSRQYIVCRLLLEKKTRSERLSPSGTA